MLYYIIYIYIYINNFRVFLCPYFCKFTIIRRVCNIFDWFLLEHIPLSWERVRKKFKFKLEHALISYLHN